MALKKTTIFIWLLLPITLLAQERQKFSLTELIETAYENQPALQISVLEREITENNVRSSLSGWLPQAGLEADYFRYFEQPVVYFPISTIPSRGLFRKSEQEYPSIPTSIFLSTNHSSTTTSLGPRARRIT